MSGAEPTPAGDSSSELVEWVDEDGRVIDVVPRAEIRRRRLRHRCTYIVVRDRFDRVLVHRRAEWKDVYPGWWDLAFGGVCGVGDDWTEAARRELTEEAGLSAPLRDLGPVRYEGEDGAVLGRLFVADHDGPFQGTDGEVVETEWISRGALREWTEGRSVCRDSLAAVLPAVIALTD